MSWEEMNVTECPCPCEQGRIFRENYSDDWNRHKSSLPIIECAACKSKYHIESFSYHTCDGEYRSTYYCVPNGYPAYTGAKTQGKFTSSYNVRNLDCTQYLIENYSLKILKDVLSTLNSCGTYSKIKDNGIGATARKIIRSYKGWYGTQRITIIAEAINQAIQKYFEYECRFDTLEKARSKYKAYEKQKKADSILINL